MEEGNNGLAREIGAAVRKHRMRRGLSTRGLAAAAGVSQPFLSNVENGRAMVSVPSLYRIAAALEVSPAELMPSDEQSTIVVRSADLSGHGTLAADPDDPGRIELIKAARARAIEAHRFELRPGHSEAQWYTHPGEDFLYLLEGRLRVGVGDTVHELGTGDSMWLDGRQPHRWSTDAADTSGTRLLLVTVAHPESESTIEEADN